MLNLRGMLKIHVHSSSLQKVQCKELLTIHSLKKKKEQKENITFTVISIGSVWISSPRDFFYGRTHSQSKVITELIPKNLQKEEPPSLGI